MKTYLLDIQNVGEDMYCLMSKGHHDIHKFMRAVRVEYPSWPLGTPWHTWHRVVPDSSGEYSFLYLEAEPGARGAFPTTWVNEAYGADVYKPPQDAAPCEHPSKKNCNFCGERFCPNDGCDPNHLENCREAMRP